MIYLTNHYRRMTHAQILHKRAMTTHAIRAEIQRSTESVATLSRRYGINPKTVRKWRSRQTVEDTRMGPKAPRSTSLTPLEEAAAVTFRQKTLLHIDISEIRTGEGKAYLFVAVDRTSKFVHAQLYRKMTRQNVADFL